MSRSKKSSKKSSSAANTESGRKKGKPRPSKTASGSRTILRDVLLGLVVCVVFFALIEGALRVVGFPARDPGDDPFVGFSAIRPLFKVVDGVASTDPSRLSYFNQVSFPARKPPGTFRAFAFGGSTTYGQPFDGRIAFPRWLHDLMKASSPERDFEVINAGGISYASYRIVPLIKETLQYQPDLMIIYIGQNEFLERRTYAGLFDQGRALVSARSFLESLNVYQALKNALEPLLPRRDVTTRPVDASAGKGLQSGEPSGTGAKPGPPLLDEEVNAILDRSAGLDLYHRDEEFAVNVFRHFEHNLRAMISLCSNAGVPVILVQPASNLKDFSPFKSEHGTGFTVKEKADMDEDLRQLAEAVRKGDHEQALPQLDAAISKDPLFAETYYWKAKALLGLGRIKEAKEDFIKAKDLDVCPLRCVTPIEQAIDRIAAEEHVPLVQFRAEVDRVETRIGDKSGIPGNDTFLDHVHPTVAMHQRLAEMILDTLTGLGIVAPSQNLSPEERQSLYKGIMDGFDQSFFATRDLNLAKLLRWAGKKDEAREVLQRAAGVMADNPEVHKMLGSYLADEGRHGEAVEEYRKAVQLAGNESRMRFDLAVACHRAGLKGEAADIYRDLIADEKFAVEAYANLAVLYLEQGKADLAVQTLESGLKKSPQSYSLFGPYGLALAVSGKPAEGISWTLRAVEAEPGNPRNLYNLAGMYALTGKTEDSLRSLNRAVDLGYANADKLEKDPVFGSLRNTPEFGKILRRIR